MSRSSTGKPTVLVLASTYPRWVGDPEPGFVHELCRRLSARFDVVAVVPDAPGADPSGFLDGVCVVRYRYAPRSMETLVNNGGIAANLKRYPWKWLLVPTFIVGQWFAARRIMRERSVDVIHAHWLIPQGVIARLIGGWSRTPYVVTSHGGDLFGFRGRVLTQVKRWVAYKASRMTVVSFAMSAETVRLALAGPSPQVIPMGVDLKQRFLPDPNVGRERDRLLFVGRLVAKKGLPHLLEAMPAIVSARPAVVLDIVGFGPMLQQLQEKVSELGLDQHVRFLGPMPQEALPDLYHKATLFVAPFVRDTSGDQEGLPVVLMEAIGCGCPIVVGRVAGIDDLLGDALADVSVDAEKVQELALRVIEALNNPQREEEIARRLRDVAVDVIDWQVVAERYGDLLEQAAIASES